MTSLINRENDVSYKAFMMKSEKPKVFILIDANHVNGPCKGILQFLKRSESCNFDYLLCNFGYNSPAGDQLKDFALEKCFNFFSLTQSHRLDPSPITAARALIRSTSCNIIQSHGYKSHFVALILSKMLNLPWVSVAHGWTSEHLWVKLLNSLDSFLLRQSTVSIGVSPPITQYLTSIRGARRTELILNAIDDFGIEGLGTSKEIRKRFKADSKTLLIGCFGRLSAEKGQKFLIQALGLCRRRGYNFKAILLGKGPEEIRLRALVSKLGLQDSIFFEGYSSLMRDYYDAIDLLVIPSLSEGLPNVLLEAAYFNVPAISSDVGAVREVIGEGNGWLVKPGCSKALAKKIIEVETNRDSLQSVKEKVGRSLYPKFCPDERARKFAAIYHHTISTVKTTKKV